MLLGNIRTQRPERILCAACYENAMVITVVHVLVMAMRIIDGHDKAGIREIFYGLSGLSPNDPHAGDNPRFLVGSPQ